MGRSPCCEKNGLNKGPWTPHEDQILVSYIRANGHSNWRALPKLAGLSRCGKSCRLRWINYLRPDIKRGNFTPQEEETILKLHELLGNRWSAIAAKLPGRTDNEIKNIWHTHLKKRVLDPNQLTTGSTTDPAPKPAKKRVRKSRVTKSAEISKRLKVENVECVQLQHNNSNNNDDTEGNGDKDECAERPTRFVKLEELSPQPCVSTSEMSTVTSTSSTSKEIGEVYFGDFPEISDEFWLKVLSVEDTAMSTDQEHLPSISEYKPNTLPDHTISEQVFELESGDEMDFFWHNLLTRTSTGDLPEFSDIAL